MKATMDIRVKAVTYYSDGLRTAKELGEAYNVSERTVRRWNARFVAGGVEGLTPDSTAPKHSAKQTPRRLVNRIIALKKRYPAWGARRIKHQFGIPLHWVTVHGVLKDNGLLFRIKAKPQPCKRFQRKHVDSLWQGDTFQFRIKDVGKVYVTGFTDDCSRYRVQSKVYLRKGAAEASNALAWALRKGRAPRQIYLDNGKQFVSKAFKASVPKGIKLIYGRPYHPKGRGKIEAYHKVLYRELITLRNFTSLSHFRRELRKFDARFNNWRKQEILGWRTPIEIYNDKRYFNKQNPKPKSGQMSS